MAQQSRVLIISGSMGSGKTTVMGEVSDVLLADGIRHAAMDLDAVAVHLLPESLLAQVHRRNVTAFYDNSKAAGIDRFVVAVAVEGASVLRDLREAFRDAEITICRLTAAEATMAARLRQREPGIRQGEFVARSRELECQLSEANLEDFTVSNDGRNVTEVAKELLVRARWR